MTLDQTDKEILRELRTNARISNRKLADIVGLSPSACLARVRRLEQNNVIAGYHARLSSPATGETLLSCAISLEGLPAEACDAFLKSLTRTAGVVCVFQATGAFDVFLYFACRDLADWRAFCASANALGISPGHMRSALITQSLKATWESADIAVDRSNSP